MILLAVSIAAFVLAMPPALLFIINWQNFHPLPAAPTAANLPPISVLIPARNEESSITRCLKSVLANTNIEFEVIVLDDHSDDKTASIITGIMRTEPRLRLEPAPELPSGWCGKQHACQVLSQLARHDLLLWIDADVRLAPDALPRLTAWMQNYPHIGLISGVPHEETITALERLLIPLMHYIILNFLPIPAMRRRLNTSLGAGCGQLFVARRNEYERAGGHAAIRSSLHDGIKLPRAFRLAGIFTDLFDATDLAACRMYHSAGEVFFGLAKNATEGMASPKAIWFWSILLFGGQVLPVFLLLDILHLLLESAQLHAPVLLAAILSATALLSSIAVRLASAHRYRQCRLWAFLHPFGITMFLIIQWYALFTKWTNKPAIWKGRSYP